AGVRAHAGQPLVGPRGRRSTEAAGDRNLGPGHPDHGRSGAARAGGRRPGVDRARGPRGADLRESRQAARERAPGQARLAGERAPEPALMLERLTIQDLALVERAEIVFGPGLNALTGET